MLAALFGGILTAASPCTLAAIPIMMGYVGGTTQTPRQAWWLSLNFIIGLNITLLGLGLLAARLGMLFGNLSPSWSMAMGVLLIGLALWLLLRPATACMQALPSNMQQKFARSGHWGALILGGLVGTVLSPCATPALAAVLTLISTGSWLGSSMWWGLWLLLLYGLGHSVLLLLAGAVPSTANRLIRQLSHYQRWLPGQRSFAVILLLAGVWWFWQGWQLSA